MTLLPRFDDASDEEGISDYLRTGKFVVLFLLVGLGGWATLLPISGAVIAVGSIAVEAKSKTVQHLEGGIVGEILVKDGDLVTAGDLVIRFDDGQLNQQIAGLDAGIKSKTEEIELVQAELDGLSDLAAKGLVPKTRITALQRQAVNLRGEHGQLSAERTRANAKLVRLEVRAPIGGYVHNLAFHTIGGVASPGQALMQIVPSKGNMIVQARIEPHQIDQVHLGQEATIRLSGFNQRTTPQVNGKVAHVSADLSRDEQNDKPFYRVHFKFNDGEIARLGRDLVPGMPVETYIQTEGRTTLSYLMRPLTESTGAGVLGKNRQFV